MDILLSNENAIRLSCFLAVLLLMMLWEWTSPRRPLDLPRTRRWAANLGMVVVDTLALRLLMPLLAVSAASLAAARGWGLFNGLGAPYWLACLASLLVLDLAIYTQHLVFHRVPLLWRIHRTHHSDLNFDVTTALRFHPLEILLSMLIKLSLVVLLGAPAPAVLLFEVILNATAMFNHGNVYLPPKADRLLRLVIVTPDMHRVHHSIHREETDSNFGFNLPWWDRLFGTYRAQPRDGHKRMILGLEIFRDFRSLGLHWLLLQPFLKTTAPVQRENARR
jgi:sterol desaturase/sphingolipid hydroxylase (fatty acid hydroxylase superfamily)